MSAQQYIYSYPRPRVATDAVVFTEKDGKRHVLLIQRKNEPFAGMWALPGGFVEMEESLETAAARELEEETGLNGVALKQFHTFGDPGRDPRGRSISIAYMGEVDWRQHAPRGGDDAADAQWFPLDDLPSLAFDHRLIMEYAVKAYTESTFA